MQLSRRQIIAYVAVAAVVVAVGVRYVVLPRQAGPSEAQAVVLAPVSAPASPAAAESAGAAASPAPDVVVYVCGAVRSPGVVRLPAGARVTDALELAGGPTAGAELAAVNLAAPVTDGQQIVVPERGAPAVAAAPAPAVFVRRSGGRAGGVDPRRARQHQHGLARGARRTRRRRAVHRAEDHRLPHGQRRLQDHRGDQGGPGHRRRQVRGHAGLDHRLRRRRASARTSARAPRRVLRRAAAGARVAAAARAAGSGRGAGRRRAGGVRARAGSRRPRSPRGHRRPRPALRLRRRRARRRPARRRRPVLARRLHGRARRRSRPCSRICRSSRTTR